MKTVKKVNVRSIANVYGYFLAIVGFFTAIAIAITNVVNIIIAEGFSFSALFITSGFNLVMGVLVGLISALAGFFIGYFSGLILAWFYNLAVRMKFIGGIKIDLE